MDTVIYSATPLRAFSGLIFLTVFFFVLGLVGAFTGILQAAQEWSFCSRGLS